MDLITAMQHQFGKTLMDLTFGSSIVSIGFLLINIDKIARKLLNQHRKGIELVHTSNDREAAMRRHPAGKDRNRPRAVA